MDRKNKKIKLTAFLLVIFMGVGLCCKVMIDQIAPPGHYANKPFRDENFSYLLHLLEDYF